ncbi:hypothetical protein BBJ28_00009667 [Nothophytophthora sp. Chile5]|nr:hypothetical protein BBJ28_00009667 [Nothophytophthora sp. Chile5]
MLALDDELAPPISNKSGYYYAALRTPPSSPRSGVAAPPSSNWTVLSSLHHSAILGEQAAKMPLLIRVRRARVLSSAVGLVVILLLLVGVFAGGVSVGTRDSVASVAVLSKYNFYTGTVASMLAKPFELALALFVPVLSLVVAPRDSLQNDSLGWRVLLVCAQGTLSALLTGAFSTLNVQQLDPRVAPTIVASDLSAVSPSSSKGTSAASSSVIDDLTFSLRLTTDTLLRTAIQPALVKATESLCQGSGGWPNIATTYAFFANDWLASLLPNGREALLSLYTSVGEMLPSSASSAEGAAASKENASAVEYFNATVAGNLLLYGMFFSQTLLAWDGLSYLENSSLAHFQDEVASWRAEEGTNTNESGSSQQQMITTFRLAASRMLSETLSEQSSRLGLAFDSSAASFNVSHIALSPDIAFDAVTLEIPFDERVIATNGSASTLGSISGSGADGKRHYDLISSTQCGETACLIPPPGGSASSAILGDADYTQWNAEPQIQAFAACLFEDGTEDVTSAYLHGSGCTRRSTTSFLVFSFARRVVADEMTLAPEASGSSSTSSPNSRIVTVTNLQRYHMITIGRLSWRTKDLAAQFNALCDVSGDDNDCSGLSFRLGDALPSSSTTVKHLIVGASHLPLDSLGEFSGLYSRWTPLVMLTTPSDMQGDLLFRRNVRHGQADDWANLSGQCSTSIDVFVTQIEQNRWFMEYGLQEAYTAALFLLLQNAVVREESTRVDGRSTLAFAGSTTSVTLEARIPLQSAAISVVGSLIGLVCALCIASAGRHKEGVIQRDLGVEEIAKVLLVDRRFPPVFLDCTLDDPHECVQHPLHTFHIEALVLHQQEEARGATASNSSKGAGVFIRYPPQF